MEYLCFCENIVPAQENIPIEICCGWQAEPSLHVKKAAQQHDGLHNLHKNMVKTEN